LQASADVKLFIPVVFAAVGDPVALGVVRSLAHPGGNVIGFLAFEYTFTAKSLELLKEIAPRVRRAAILRDPARVSLLPVENAR
jgi:putative ABC transport system substrate-binding protein